MSRNPLESLGVPKYIVAGIWGDPAMNEEQRVARLMDIIKSVYRGLQRAFHSDVAGENPYIREITEAFEDIEPEVLPGIVSRYISTADIQWEHERATMRQQVDRAQARVTSLLPFLGMTDWRRLVGGASPVELLFGLPENLWGEGRDYLNTYLLALGGDTQPLTRLAHPNDGDLLNPLKARFSRVPVWRDGRWEVDDFDYASSITPQPKTYTYAAAHDLGKVTLVGQIRSEVMFSLASAQGSRPTPKGTTMQSIGSLLPTSTVSLDLVWWDPLDAWWLPGLESQLQKGSYAVAARGEGSHLRLSILGRYLTDRPL